MRRAGGRASTALALVLTAVGLLQIAGSLAGSRPLLAAGAWSGASPLPRVFSRQQGIETFARRARIALERASGPAVPVAVDRGFGRRVEGPVVRVAAFAHAALYAGLRSPERDAALLRHAFCRPGRVTRELGLEGPVTGLRVRNWSALANDERLAGLEVSCRP